MPEREVTSRASYCGTGASCRVHHGAFGLGFDSGARIVPGRRRAAWPRRESSLLRRRPGTADRCLELAPRSPSSGGPRASSQSSQPRPPLAGYHPRPGPGLVSTQSEESGRARIVPGRRRAAWPRQENSLLRRRPGTADRCLELVEDAPRSPSSGGPRVSPRLSQLDRPSPGTIPIRGPPSLVSDAGESPRARIVPGRRRAAWPRQENSLLRRRPGTAGRSRELVQYAPRSPSSGGPRAPLESSQPRPPLAGYHPRPGSGLVSPRSGAGTNHQERPCWPDSRRRQPSTGAPRERPSPSSR